jgi:hypothetical protein
MLAGAVSLAIALAGSALVARASGGPSAPGQGNQQASQDNLTESCPGNVKQQQTTQIATAKLIIE